MIISQCDNCSSSIVNGDEVYCKKCFLAQQQLVADLMHQVKELEERIEILMIELREEK
jgi:hypothetical protein